MAETDTPGIVVAGASGRMGQMLVNTVLATPGLRLHGALERAGNDWVGQDLGTAMGRGPLGVTVSDDPLETLAKARGVIDFTAPAATLELAEIAAQARLVHVIGTTGMTDEDLTKIDAAARHATIVRAGNMSLGVNLLMGLVAKTAAALGADYDVEVLEMHHRHKVDAPSGTALMLGEAAAQGRGQPLSDLRDPPRDGITGARPQGTIGFANLRGGDVIGDHTVIFAGGGERIEIAHKATDRALFAQGAVRALQWGLDQGPGHYAMTDVLGL